MDTKQFHRRVWAVVLLLSMMVTIMGGHRFFLPLHCEFIYSISHLCLNAITKRLQFLTCKSMKKVVLP